MSNNRGIFENLQDQPSSSPFSVTPDPAAPIASPFASEARINSPFAAADDSNASKSKLPERRKSESPFQVADSHEGFGFEATAPSPFATSPFEVVPTTSPFAIAPVEPVARVVHASPFSTEPAPAAPAFAPQPAADPSPEPSPYPVFTQTPTVAPAPAPAVVSAPAPTPNRESDSSSIRQIELRAIFGVDREMSTEEIMQRARSLPGIRHVARVGHQDLAAVEGIKQLVANLGFAGGSIKLYAGSVLIEFIREAEVLLAVQTDGGFAPGVRETLMIVARELGRSA